MHAHELGQLFTIEIIQSNRLSPFSTAAHTRFLPLVYIASNTYHGNVVNEGRKEAEREGK